MVEVWKGAGAGNTFYIVVEPHISRAVGDLPTFAKKYCGRKIDGLIVIGPGKHNDKNLAARIINRDGTEGGVCLNGLRAAAVWTKQDGGQFEMDGHIIPWRRIQGRVELHLRVEDLPGEMSLTACSVDGRQGMIVPFWNPHCVFPVESLADVDLDSLAANVRKNVDQFPDGVNVEIIADASDGSMHARVNERGVGETKSCASGAVAIALVAWAGGLKGSLDVRMPGGVLRIARAANGGILLSGGAVVAPGETWSIP
ncbi:MAG: hypothetical protein HN844_02515 [Planctomycetes bacterium]|nr:hypothetical protein [Planctomycetota bacterium]MBT4560223.1 hypothetical protein [Planctomycetota bacterium]MBT7318071.1 hypothetical protein [Planctomycetota bacterium]